MDDAFACSHPLEIARSYGAFVTFEIFVIEVSLLHVGDCFEATVGVVWEACGKSDFEVVEHEERI